MVDYLTMVTVDATLLSEWLCRHSDNMSSSGRCYDVDIVHSSKVDVSWHHGRELHNHFVLGTSLWGLSFGH